MHHKTNTVFSGGSPISPQKGIQGEKIQIGSAECFFLPGKTISFPVLRFSHEIINHILAVIGIVTCSSGVTTRGG
jgi:hypothetical protein